jgi:hypothetical protein
MFTEMARALGRQMAASEGSTEEQIVELFRRCLTRLPDEEERAELVAFHAAQLERFVRGELDAMQIAGEGAGDPKLRAAWTLTARVLLNLDEAITRN